MPYGRRVILESGMTSDQVLYLVFGLTVFVLLMVGAWLLLRWLSKKGLGGGRSKHMKVLDRLVISRDSYILLLQIAGRIFAVSVGKDSSSLICEIPHGELGFDEQERQDKTTETPAVKAAENPGFWKRFSHNMRLNMGLLPKGTQPMAPPSKSEPTPKESAEAFKEVLERIQQAQQTNSNPSGSPESGRAVSGQNHANDSGRPEAGQRNSAARSGRGKDPDEPQAAPDKDKVADYNAIIENMKNLGLVDKPQSAPRRREPDVAERYSPHADREAKEPVSVKNIKLSGVAPATAAAYSAYSRNAGYDKDVAKAEAAADDAGITYEASPVSVTGGEPDKYDMMFDLIARRQARYAGRKDRGKESP